MLCKHAVLLGGVSQLAPVANLPGGSTHPGLLVAASTALAVRTGGGGGGRMAPNEQLVRSDTHHLLRLTA